MLLLKDIINFMLICLCYGKSERDIDREIANGAQTADDIGERCGAGTGCGACVGEISQRLAQGRGCPERCPDALVALRSPHGK